MPYYHIFGIQFKKKNEKINLFESNKLRLIKLRKKNTQNWYFKLV